MTSIRRRTASLVILGTFGLLAFGGASLFVVIRGLMTAQFDEALTAKASALQSVTVFDNIDDLRVEMNISGESSPAPYYAAWTHAKDEWQLIDSGSHDAPEHQGEDDHWPDPRLCDIEPGAYDIELPGDVDGRAVVVDFAPRYEDDDAVPDPATPDHNLSTLTPPTVRLAVAAPRAQLDRSLQLIAWCIAGVCTAFAVASVIATRWAVTLGLAPLTDLSQRVRALGPETLATRLDAPALPAELRPIADQLNALLARLDEAFQREQRFTAAASHELRTPIAELRMLLEVAASQPRSGEQWSRTAETALSVLARAQALSETLLRLSRAGSSHAIAPAKAIADVSAIIAEQTQRSIATNNAPPDLVRIDAPSALEAAIEPAALASIVGNLIDNALRHAEPTPDSPVTIHAAHVDDTDQSARIHIEVTNPSARLTAGDVPHLFEPFWQREASRTDRRGFGLGLAVARTLARAAGGDITASLDTAAHTLTVRVDLPSRTNEPGSASGGNVKSHPN